MSAITVGPTLCRAEEQNKYAVLRTARPPGIFTPQRPPGTHAGTAAHEHAAGGLCSPAPALTAPSTRGPQCLPGTLVHPVLQDGCGN